MTPRRRPLGEGDSPLLWGVRLGRLAGVEIRLHLLTAAWAAIVLLASLPRDGLGFTYAAVGLLAWLAVVGARDLARGALAGRARSQHGPLLVWPTGGAWESQAQAPGWGWLAAGPAISAGLAAAAAGTLAAIGAPPAALALNPLAPGRALAALLLDGPSALWAVALWWIFAAGAILTLVHLLPARPLDGGLALERALAGRDGLGARRRVDAIGVGVGAGLVALGAAGGGAAAMGLGVMVGLLSWWDLRLLSLPAELAADPGSWAPASPSLGEERPAEALELDRVLEKINRAGMGSLSRRELRFLQEETARRRGG